MSWYCNYCGELSLRFFCEHCGKPKRTRKLIAVVSFFGLIIIPIIMYWCLSQIFILLPQVAGMGAVEQNIVNIIPISFFPILALVGYSWLIILSNWIELDGDLRRYYSKKLVVR